MNPKKGFTLIELLMVIVILGILAMVAIPYYTNLSTRASNAAEQGVVGGVRAGIHTYHAGQNPPAYPAPSLDSVATGTPCSATNPCFVTVLSQGGITDSVWEKGTVATRYIHRGPDGIAGGGDDSFYDYTAATGQFVCNTTLGVCP